MAKREVLHVPGVVHGAPIPTAVKIGNMVFSSGVMGRHPETGELGEGAEQQAEYLFIAIENLMKAAGGTVDDIAHFTIFMKDRADRPALDAQWLKMFPDENNRPARHAIQADLPGGMLIQVELQAILG